MLCGQVFQLNVTKLIFNVYSLILLILQRNYNRIISIPISFAYIRIVYSNRYIALLLFDVHFLLANIEECNFIFLSPFNPDISQSDVK